MPPEPALHHLALGARDVELVASFYSQALHMHELQRHFDAAGKLRSIWLKLGEAILMIERTSHERPFVEGVDAGLFLLALRVDTSERPIVEQHITNLGFPVESRTEHTSYFRDPEGNRVAVSSYPT